LNYGELQKKFLKARIKKMERILIKEAVKKVGKEVCLSGWVDAYRDHGKLVFIDLRDRSGVMQVVGDKKLGELRNEDVISVVGKIRKRPSSMINKDLPTGEVELSIEKLNILSKAAELPFDIGSEELSVQLPTLLDYRPLTLRHSSQKAIFKVQEKIIESFRNFLKEKDFTEIFCPTITVTATEGGAELFKVNYFDYDAFLTQSPQFYKQIAIGAFERVFTIAHAYRAEPSITTRHMTEYIGLDAEMAFIESWQDIYQLADEVLKFIFQEVEKIKPEIEKLRGKKFEVPKTVEETPILKLKEALEIIYKRTKRDNRQEPDLSPEDEREICLWAKEEKDSDLIIITHYPTEKRPMYTYPDPKDPKHTLSFDILGKGVEWVTGGQRINDYQQLLKSIKGRGYNPDNFSFYLQAFKYGLPPEGGFCMGLERITQNILGLSNVREASLFPRDLERVDISLSKVKKERSKKDDSLFEKIVKIVDDEEEQDKTSEG